MPRNARPKRLVDRDVGQIHALRRVNLRSLCLNKFENNRSELARALGKNSNQIRLVLTDNAEIGRNLGEAAAREYESLLGLPPLWLDQDHQTPGLPQAISERNKPKGSPDSSISGLPPLHEAVVTKFISLARAGAIDDRLAHEILGKLLAVESP